MLHFKGINFMKSRILFACFALVCAGIVARADSVFVKGREKAVVGDIKNEDAKGVVINTIVEKKKVDEFFPASEILDIHYNDVKPVDLNLSGGAYKVAKDAEKDLDAADASKRKIALNTAINKYIETSKQMQPHKHAKRMIEYKIAVLTVRQAVTEQLPTDKAIARLQGYKTAYPTSWQVTQVMPMIAQLQMDAKDFKGAEQTFQEMADMEALPADVRTSAELEVVRVSVLAGNIAQAQKKLDALAAKAKGDPKLAARVKMTRAEVLIGLKKNDEAMPLLQQVLKETNDKQIKAIAHNTIGEHLYKAGKYNEALWEFLWVDAVFNQDRSQNAKALYYLWKTFEQLNNAERAQECRELLLNDKQYTGTEYHAKAVKEAK